MIKHTPTTLRRQVANQKRKVRALKQALARRDKDIENLRRIIADAGIDQKESSDE